MKTNFALLLSAFCFSLISCYTPRYVYSPSAHNVPVLSQKGDSKLAVNYSSNFVDAAKDNANKRTVKGHGFDLQAAHAVSAHWAVMLNYFNRKERNSGDFDAGNRDSVTINYTRNMTEIGAGWFLPLNENKLSVLQIFGGVGFGKSRFTDEGKTYNTPYRTRFHNMDVTRIFIQPAFMIRTKNSFSAALSNRFSIVYFKNIHTDYNSTELDNYKLDSLTISPRSFWEPSTVYSFGHKSLPGLRLEIQMGMAFLISQRFVDYRSLNFSIGIMADLPKLLRKKTPEAKN